jgi:hypothetical protein
VVAWRSEIAESALDRMLDIADMLSLGDSDERGWLP